MRNYFGLNIGIGLLLLTGGASAQTPSKTFEVASVKAAAPDAMQKMMAAAQSGKMPNVGMHVDGARVEYIFLDLKTLCGLAYKLKPYQVTAPDWMTAARFDIMAKLPAGATRDDLPEMLKALLKDRLKVEAHMESKEHPVLALVVGKNGPKMTESKEAPKAIDETVPLKEGEMQQDTPDGPVRVSQNMSGGSFTGTADMGLKGKMTYSMARPAGAAGAAPSAADLAGMSLHMDAKMMTMAGLAEMLTQFTSLGGASKQIVDMTGLKGHYDISLDIPLADLMNMVRAAGVDVPNMPSGGASASGPTAADPSGGTSLLSSVTTFGLKLENRKAVIDQLVVDKAEKTPTEN